MKRKLSLLILSIFMISLIGCGAEMGHEGKEEPAKEDIVKSEEDTDREETLTIEDYYPFKENVVLDYEGIGNEYAEKKTFIEFVEDNRAQMKISNPGTNFVKVVEYKKGVLIEVFSEGEFYHIENMINANTNSQEIILQEPLEVGTSWSTEEGLVNKRITSINANIDTPSGSYRALEVTTELKGGGTQRDYYAKGIGPVASIYTDGDFEVKTLLKKIINDKNEINILTYYPTKEDIGTKYIEQNIKFSTNDNIEEVLEKIMKEPPNEKLIPIITKGTKINEINLNRNSWTLEVDFSKELLTEMNAGSGFEMEILRSIVNTLGEFYDVEKVYITVEDKPYESGHYGIEENEFFKVDKIGVEEFKE